MREKKQKKPDTSNTVKNKQHTRKFFGRNGSRTELVMRILVIRLSCGSEALKEGRE